MPDLDEEILKEEINVPQDGLKSTRWRSIVSFVLSSFAIAYGFYMVLFFVLASFGSMETLNETDEIGWPTLQKFGTEVIDKAGKFMLFIGVSAVLGPFAALGMGGASIAFLAMYAFSMIAIVRGYKCKERWIGKALGISGMVLWFFVGSFVLGNSI